MALKVAIDTNTYVDFARGDQSVREQLEQADAIAVPFPVLGELRAGFAAGSRVTANERRLRQFLEQPGVGVLWAAETTTPAYASLFAYLRQRGTPIPINDLWIAALCLEHDFPLLTNDRHFDGLPQIPRA